MIKIKKSRATEEVNASSMADIAFLLFIFFLITTTIAVEYALETEVPPPDTSEIEPEKIPDRNLYKILLNSNDKILVEDEPSELGRLKEGAKKFINNANEANDPASSMSPQNAIISFQVDRGTKYSTYVNVVDQLEAAYHELRADYLGITVDEYLKLDKNNPEHFDLLYKAKLAYPWNLSESEPTEVH